MNLIKERDKALAKARSYARSGNAVWAQQFIDRANAFYPVSQTQVNNVQKLLDAAKKR